MSGPLATVMASLLGLGVLLCGASLVAHTARRDGRQAVAEANQVLAVLVMAGVVLLAHPDVVPILAGAALFGGLAAAWVGFLFVRLLQGDDWRSPIGDAGRSGNPMHLVLANITVIATYGLATSGALASGRSGLGVLSRPQSIMPTDTSSALDIGVAALVVYLVVHAGATIGAMVVSRPARGALVPGPVARIRQGGQAALSAGMALMLLTML